MRGLGKGREDEGCSFAGFSFSPCIIFYFAFENQSDGCDKQHNICFKRKDLKIFTRACTLLQGHGDYVKIWHYDRAYDSRPLKEINSNKEILKLKGIK